MQKFRKVTHVLFDLDGLLLDTERLYTDIANKILSKYGKCCDWSIKLQLMGLRGHDQARKLVELLELPLTPDEYYQMSKALYKNYMNDAVLMPDSEHIYKMAIVNIAKKFGKIYTPEIQAKVLGTIDTLSSEIAVNEMKLPISSEQFLQEFRALTKRTFQKPVPLMPGAERLVKHLHSSRVPIAVASSSHHDSFLIKTAAHRDLFKLFHHVVTGGDDPDVKNGKPAPDIFLVCASRFEDKPAPKDCLVFEDAPNGATAALKAGMQCVIVPDKHVPEEMYKHATLKLNSLVEFKPELFGLPPIKA